jgi:hypothetical protein
MNREERARVIELIHGVGLSVQDKVRRIHEEMPHLTTAEVIEVCETDAEMLHQDAAVQRADAEASRSIADILGEAGYRNAGEALPALESRSRNGDTRATVLLKKLIAALNTVGISDDNSEDRKRLD